MALIKSFHLGNVLTISLETLTPINGMPREEIKALTGVDLMLDENTYKSTAMIITELGEVYNSLTDVSQAALLEKIAGDLICLNYMETYFYRTHLIARIA